MNTTKKVFNLLTKNQRKKLYWLIFPMMAVAVLSTVGIAFIMPLLAIITDASLISSNQYLGFFYSHFSFKSHLSFTIFIASACFLMLLFSNMLSLLTTWKSYGTVFSIEKHLKSSLYNNYLSNEYEFFITQNSSKAVNTLFVLIPNICQNYILRGIQAVSSLALVLSILVLIVLINPSASLYLSVLFGTFYYLLFKLVKGRVRKNSLDLVKKSQNSAKLASESLGGVKDIKQKNLEEMCYERFSESLDRVAEKQAFNQAISQTPRYVLELIVFGGLILYILIMLYLSNDISKIIPTIAVYVYSGYRLMPALQQVFSGFSFMKSVSADIDFLYDISKTEAPSEKTNSNTAAQNTPEDVSFREDVFLKNIYYRYPGSDLYTIEGVNLLIEKNKTIGIIGATGSGKTTLVDIILGLLQPQKGSILVDGVSLNNPSALDKWKKKIGYVSQNIFLTDRTIKENIAFGLKESEICEQRIRKVARIASISQFIEESLPAAYDTIVGERGVRLSGGQIQRIGIARALYENPEILVLDEATSALDLKTESEVMKSVYSLKQDITLIIIAHRLSTLDSCDIIYKVDKGKVCQHKGSILGN